MRGGPSRTVHNGDFYIQLAAGRPGKKLSRYENEPMIKFSRLAGSKTLRVRSQAYGTMGRPEKKNPQPQQEPKLE